MLGIWTTASRQKTLIYPDSHVGPWTQLSRLGNPLINEVIIPMGMKDYWNTQPPLDDKQFSSYYDHPTLAALLNVLYPGAFPNIAAYSAVAGNTRPDLDAVLLTGVPAGLFPGFQNFTGTRKSDMLRLNVAIKPVGADKANILGVVGGDAAGFPNGRRVYDDVVSIELKAVAGALLGAVESPTSPMPPPERSTTSAVRLSPRPSPLWPPSGSATGTPSPTWRTPGTATTTLLGRICRLPVDEMTTNASTATVAKPGHAHPHRVDGSHDHHSEDSAAGHVARPTEPSRAVTGRRRRAHWCARIDGA